MNWHLKYLITHGKRSMRKNLITNLYPKEKRDMHVKNDGWEER